MADLALDQSNDDVIHTDDAIYTRFIILMTVVVGLIGGVGALILDLSNNEVILTGVFILILLAAGFLFYYYATNHPLWNEISFFQNEPAMKVVARFVPRLFIFSMLFHWQIYSYPFVAGLQLRSINVTLDAPATRIQSETADNFTVAVLSPYLKGINKMDIQMQVDAFFHVKYLLFRVPDRCRSRILGLRCDMENEAASAVKNTDARLQHLCSSRPSLNLAYINPETKGEPKYHAPLRNDTIRTITVNEDSWHAFAAVNCGSKWNERAAPVKGRVGLQGRTPLGYLFGIGYVHAVAIFLAFYLTIVVAIGLIWAARDTARGKNVYQKILKSEPKDEAMDASSGKNVSQNILKNEPKDEATLERSKRLVQYDKIRKKVDKLRQKHQNLYGAEYKKYSAMRRNRVTRELTEIAANPLPELEVAASISNDRYVFFLLKGCVDTPFQGGTYCGMVCIPPNYPLKPPKSVIMLSPSGGYFFREGIEWNDHIRFRRKWNPNSSSLRDCFASLLTDWLARKLDWNFNEEKVQILAKWSFESCVELCPDFYDLFPSYSSAGHDETKKDSKNSTNKTNKWELVDYPSKPSPKQKVPLQKPKKKDL